MAQRTLHDYEFTNFTEELQKLDQTHSHTVRRESNITYVDEFAQAELIDLHPGMYNEYLRGWSRSYYNPERHMQAILQYGTPDIPITNINEQVYQTCMIEVKNRLHSLPRVRAFDILNQLNLVPYKTSTAAGYGYPDAKGPIGGENHQRAIRRSKAMMWPVTEDIKAGMDNAVTSFVPDIGYTRTQLTDLTEKTKVRNVWGRAFHYILLEGLTAAPLIKAFSEAETFYHIGRDPLDSVPEALSKVSSNAKWIYAIDWKQFDATVSRFEIHAAFDIVRELIIFPNFETEISYEISRQLFIHKKIAAPDGYVYWAHKGIPSGSYFTSIIGSIVNRLRIEYLWRMITGHSPLHCYTQGDDSLSSDNVFIPPERFAEVANQVGWLFNQEKTEYSTIPNDVSFLGRTMMGGLNTREIKRCLRLLIYPEYPVESGRISAFRAASISEDTGRLSSLINEIAKRLKRRYGVASEDEVPDYFKRYIM